MYLYSSKVFKRFIKKTINLSFKKLKNAIKNYGK